MDPVIFLTVELHMRPSALCTSASGLWELVKNAGAIAGLGMSAHISGKDLCFLPPACVLLLFSFTLITSIGIKNSGRFKAALTSTSLNVNFMADTDAT